VNKNISLTFLSNSYDIYCITGNLPLAKSRRKAGGRGQREPCLNRRKRRRWGRKRVKHVLAQSTVCTSARARVGLGLLEEKLSGLGWTTESLLKTMRLDVVLLGSREEEMRQALAQLKGQWEVLERLLEEQSGGHEGGGGKNKGADEEKSLRMAVRLVFTIDWRRRREPQRWQRRRRRR